MDLIGLPLTKNSMILYLVLIMIFKSILLMTFKYFSTKSVMIFLIDLRKRIYKGIFESRYGFASNKTSRFINALTTQSNFAGGSLELIYRILQTSFTLFGLVLLHYYIMEMFLLAILLGILIFSFLNITKDIPKY